MPLMIFFCSFWNFWNFNYHVVSGPSQKMTPSNEMCIDVNIIKYWSETSATSMQHVRSIYSSGCSACESHDLKI